MYVRKLYVAPGALQLRWNRRIRGRRAKGGRGCNVRIKVTLESVLIYVILCQVYGACAYARVLDFHLRYMCLRKHLSATSKSFIRSNPRNNVTCCASTFANFLLIGWKKWRNRRKDFIYTPIRWLHHHEYVLALVTCMIIYLTYVSQLSLIWKEWHFLLIYLLVSFRD